MSKQNVNYDRNGFAQVVSWELFSPSEGMETIIDNNIEFPKSIDYEVDGVSVHLTYS